MTLPKITELYTTQFSVCPNITSEFRNTAMFKISVKENNESIKTCRYVHDISMYKTSLFQVQQFMSSLHKIKCEF
jgi:hypothetical protein